MKRGVMNRLNTGLIAMALVLTQVLMPAQLAFAADDKVKEDTGNNGTLKVHEKGMPSNSESNDPKACIFNFEGFGLDAGQTGNITIETQSGSPVITPKSVSLTTDANGAGETAYINDIGSTVTLENGHYKATLDNKFGTDPGNKAKSKVFKVDCPVIPTNVIPTAPSKVDSCATTNDTFTIPVTAGVDYLVAGNVVAANTYPTNGALSIVVTARAQTGFVLSGQTTFTLTFTNTICETPKTPVTPAGPTKIDVCETEDDTFTIPVTAGVNYLIDGEIVADGQYNTDGETSITVTAQAQANYVLTNYTPWTLTFTDTICPVPNVCTVEDNLFDSPWMYDEGTYPEAGAFGGPVPATYNFEPTGLYLNTPAAESYVYGFMDAGSTALSNIDEMSYNVLRSTQSGGFAATLPAYVLLVDTNGENVAGGEKYFFYEPYYNDASRATNEGAFQLWDAKAGGSAKWYMSGTGQQLQTWDYFVAQFPDAVTLAYGFNQGTDNGETYTAVQDITFDCATTSFTNKDEGGSGGGTPIIPVIPTIPTVPFTPVVPVVPAVVTGGHGNQLPEELPLTGENGSLVFTWIAILAAILTYGSVYYLQPKKRFEQ